MFKMGTTLYNPDFDDAAHLVVTKFYDCTTLSNPTYNILVLNQVGSQPGPHLGVCGGGATQFCAARVCKVSMATGGCPTPPFLTLLTTSWHLIR